MVFMKILKLTSSKQIDMYCWIRSASLILYNKIISQNLDETNLIVKRREKPNNSTSSNLMTS
jgi:hypothetical protein